MKTSNAITKSVAAGAAAMSLTVAAFAGPTATHSPAPAAPPSLYNANELSLGFSALYGVRSNTDNDNIDKGAWGLDLDLAYFMSKNFGLSIEQQWYDFGRPLWNTSGNAIWRWPINDGAWAPYVLGGIGAVYAGGEARLEGHLGGGIEYRFSQKMGAFFDGRYNWVDGNEDTIPQYGAFRLGLRFVF